MMHVYPFSAVVGQDRLKLALVLCAVDPGIGGVLVRGPRGVAKTTLARAFAELLPGRFVELPLGATEERVTGTLDLGAALGGRGVQFSPGLLARAHDGVLYVDEANLLADALVDLLLDAAATGMNVVERDGVSHSHPARFVLVGTMNPVEGPLRAQFIDRFGLSVEADGQIEPRDRARIILQRLEFDRAPDPFVSSFAQQQAALRDRCARARERVSQIPLEGPALERVTELCHGARVEGVRADLAMLRAARAHAAWHGREVIAVEDVEAVAELALAHRRRGAPEPGTAGGSGANESGGRGPATGTAAGRKADAVASGMNTAGSQPGDTPEAPARGSSTDRGALPPVPARAVESVRLPAVLASATNDPTERLRAESSLGPRRLWRRRRSLHDGSIDWFGTLLRCPRPSHEDLRRRGRPSTPGRLWLILIDCSASMLQTGALPLAKGVAQALTLGATSAGAHVALISFSGDSARTELVSNAHGAHLEGVIGGLGAGGGTPLRRALDAALDVCKQARYRAPDVQKRAFILSDGRTRERLDDMAQRCSALQPVVIDCERGAIRLNRARGLARALGGRYLHVDTCSPTVSAAETSG